MLDLTPSEDFRLLTHERFRDQHDLIRKNLEQENLKDHFVILSSGTTSAQIKGYALSRAALMANAKAVNEHFALTKDDIWSLSLPGFHVGGLSVLVRATLLGNKVIQSGKWEPTLWAQQLHSEKVTITTVVPTQVFDLVKNNIKSPPSLRYLIVGGDFMSDALEARALELGWPVIRTFGMTEVCSQLASGKMPLEKELTILPIHQVKIDQERLLVKSEALFTLQFALGDRFTVTRSHELCDSKGYYLTQDRVHLEGRKLMPLGRLDDQIKISGRLVGLLSLKGILGKYLLDHHLYGQAEIGLVPDERRGMLLNLMYLESVPEKNLAEIREIFSPVRVDVETVLESFERTDLGKLKRVQK